MGGCLSGLCCCILSRFSWTITCMLDMIPMGMTLLMTRDEIYHTKDNIEDS
jgi:hypothetical protein